MAFAVPLEVTHFRRPGLASPGWGQTQSWALVGADPSVSSYDADFGASDSNNDRQVRNGFLYGRQRLPLDAPTLNRSGRVAAQFNSLPAARYFQSYTGAGTGQSFSPATSASVPRVLTMNANPNAMGNAELHPATTYDPFPSPSSLYPKVV